MRYSTEDDQLQSKWVEIRGIVNAKKLNSLVDALDDRPVQYTESQPQRFLGMDKARGRMKNANYTDESGELIIESEHGLKDILGGTAKAAVHTNRGKEYDIKVQNFKYLKIRKAIIRVKDREKLYSFNRNQAYSFVLKI